MVTVFFILVLLFCVTLIGFGSVLLGTSVQRRKYTKTSSKECIVFTKPGFTKSDNIKNIIFGAISVIIGFVIIAWISLCTAVGLCLKGSIPSSCVMVVFIGTLLVFLILHLFGLIKGRKIFTSNFEKTCEDSKKDCSLLRCKKI